MMISNPNLIFYACISKGTTILAEFNTKDADLGALAAKCLVKTPPLHTMFSHTIRKKTYMFLIHNPFVYFGIFDENLENSECLSFLESVKDAFNEITESDSIKRLDKLSSHCFQGEFNPVFHQLLASPADLEVLHSPREVLKHGGNGSSDWSRGKKIGLVPLLGGDRCKILKKKKKKKRLENKVDVSYDGIGLSREFTVSMQKSAYSDSGYQMAKRVWKKHVWVVLLLDLIVCSILFGIWLWICRGFKCMEG
uniref:Longin domain-containing protein n=1 Tax=Davidia involucrata TaxID=16924 RepID=A0A5B7C071_DAVIN